MLPDFFNPVVSVLGILLLIVYITVYKRFSGMATVINALMRCFGSSLFKNFSINCISIFPLRVSGITIRTKRTRSQPEAQLSIGHVKVDFDIIGSLRRLLRGEDPYNKRDPIKIWFLYIELCDFSVDSKTVRFRDFLDPPRGSKSAKKSKLTRKRTDFIQHLSRMVTVVVKNFSFDLTMPADSCRVRGGMMNMIAFTSSSERNKKDMSIRCQFTGYYLEVFDRDISAVRMTRLGMENRLDRSLDISSCEFDGKSSVEIAMIMTIEQSTETIRAEAELFGQNKGINDILFRNFLKLCDTNIW